MVVDQVDRTVVIEDATIADPAVARGRAVVRTEHASTTRTGPGRQDLAGRVIVLVFGLIQLLIGARIILLLLGAREANAIVAGILNLSQLFVAPFEGILRTDSIHSAGSVLDLAAVLALVGWTILELIVVWVVGIFRREPA